jgi:hypothetical protein
MDTTIAEPIAVVCADPGMKRMPKVTGAGQPRIPMSWHKSDLQSYCRD